MADIALYRKYRSQNFEALIGQNHVTTTIKNAVAAGRLSHAYLLSGPRGVGKTSVARLIAKAVNCTSPQKGEPCLRCKTCIDISQGKALDLIEIDAASNRGIDEIRDLKDKIHFAPVEAAYKVYIIDEAHMLTKEAFNALLKTLEEPPAHVIFILATTENHKIPATVTSRTQRFHFKKIDTDVIKEHLKQIAGKEKIEIDDHSLALIAASGEGSFRDAISLLDQLASYGGKKVSHELAAELLGLAGDKAVEEFIKNLADEDLGAVFKIINQLSAEGVDPAVFVKSVLDCLRKILAVKVGGTEIVTDPQVLKSAEKWDLTKTIRAIDVFLEAGAQSRNSVVMWLPVEVAAFKISGAQKPLKVISEKPVDERMPAKEAVPAEDLSLWRQFLFEVKTKNNTLHALLSGLSPRFSDNSVILTFQFRFHKERLEDTRNREAIERLLAKIYKRPVKLVCRLANNEEINKEAEVLKSAIEILGGEVVE